jgi:hypothetical protein
MAPIRSGSAIPASLVRTFPLVVAIICWAAPAHADQSQSFVWVADARGDTNAQVVDTAVLTPIVDRILAMSPAPKVVIFGGDAAYRGGTDNLTKFQKVFTDRLDAAGIPSAYAIGNHELYTKGDSSQYLSHLGVRISNFARRPQSVPPIVRSAFRCGGSAERAHERLKKRQKTSNLFAPESSRLAWLARFSLLLSNHPSTTLTFGAKDYFRLAFPWPPRWWRATGILPIRTV